MHPMGPSLVAAFALLVVTAANAGSFETWHPRSPLPTANTLNGVAYGNGRFVAVGDNGTIVTSSNGVDWTLGQSGVSLHLNTILFADGRFAAGGNSGVILWSDDGVNWSPGSFPLNSDLCAIGFGVGTNFPDGLFVAICSTNISFGIWRSYNILTSANGLTWEPNASCCFTTGFETRYSSITCGNNRFVASGTAVLGSLAPVAISSLTGTYWTTGVGSHSGLVAFGNGFFVLAKSFHVASNGASLLALTSANGVSWVQPSQTFSGQAFAPQAASFGGGRFVVVGDTGLTATSPDGTNWTVQRVATDAQLRSVAFGGGTYVAVGSAGFIVSSVDAESWTQRNKGTSRNLLAVAPADDGFVAVGSQGTVAWSSNGIEWESFTPSTTNSLLAVIKIESMYVAAGANGVILSGDAPGNLVAQVSGTTNTLEGIAYGKGQFVIVGNGGTILSSQNGMNWNAENSGTAANLIDVTFGSGQFAAVGPGASVLTSTDGIVWTARNTGVTMPLREIAYGQGRFVAMAGNFTVPDTNVYVTTSIDGVNWDSVLGVVPNFGAGTSYGNGYFAIILRTITSFQIATSTDGFSWRPHLITTNLPPGSDFAFNNGTFVSVGRFGRISQSDPVVRLDVSHDGMTHLTWEGPKMRQYRIEARESLAESDSWQPLATIPGPPYTWTDPESDTRTNRIYRAVLLP